MKNKRTKVAVGTALGVSGLVIFLLVPAVVGGALSALEPAPKRPAFGLAQAEKKALPALGLNKSLYQPVNAGGWGEGFADGEEEDGHDGGGFGQDEDAADCSFPEWEGLEAGDGIINEIRLMGRPYRVIPEGAPATMDYNPERINLITDENNIIREVRCG